MVGLVLIFGVWNLNFHPKKRQARNESEGKQGEYIEVTEIKSSHHLIEKSTQQNVDLVTRRNASNHYRWENAALRSGAGHLPYRISSSEVHDLQHVQFCGLIVLFSHLDHDSEVGRKGVLFYGAPALPVLTLSERH